MPFSKTITLNARSCSLPPRPSGLNRGAMAPSDVVRSNLLIGS